MNDQPQVQQTGSKTSEEVKNAVLMIEKISKGEVITGAERLDQITELVSFYNETREQLIKETFLKIEKISKGQEIIAAAQLDQIREEASTILTRINEGKDQEMYLIGKIADFRVRPKQTH